MSSKSTSSFKSYTFRWYHTIVEIPLSVVANFCWLIYVAECDIRMDFDMNEYPNIFVSRKWYEWITEYICMNIFDTSEYPNIFVLKFWYEQISE